MHNLYNKKAPKKATNLSINSHLLARARELNFNLSAILEQALTGLLKEKERELWQKENKEAIEAYNNFVDENGVFSDELRNF